MKTLVRGMLVFMAVAGIMMAAGCKEKETAKTGDDAPAKTGDDAPAKTAPKDHPAH